jgi:hypothetical protein
MCPASFGLAELRRGATSNEVNFRTGSSCDPCVPSVGIPGTAGLDRKAGSQVLPPCNGK